MRFKQSQSLWLCVAWLAIAGTVILVSIPTLLVAPSVYPDEVGILDYGRGIFEPKSDWSVMWNIASDRPTKALYVLGVSIPEIAYQLTGSSMAGVRLSGILGGILAATFFLLWMRAAGVKPWIALAGATAFLLDPLFVGACRSGRVDMWAMASILLACWMIRESGRSANGAVHDSMRFAGAGVLLAWSPFFWVSAVFLFPLVVAEMFSVPLSSRASGCHKLYRALVPRAFFAGGWMAGLSLMLFLIWPIFNEAWGDTLALSKAAGSTEILGNVFAFLESFRLNPFLLVAVLPAVAVVWRRNKLLIVVVFLTTLLLIPSGVYHWRAAYALPVYYAIVVTACSFLLASASPVWCKYMGRSILALLLVLNIGISIGLRHWIGMARSHANNPALLIRMAEEGVGRGPHKVYDANMQFYYAGRQLGWKMYRPLGANGRGDWSDEKFSKFLGKVDVVILPISGERRNVEQFSDDEERVVKSSGFELKGTYSAHWYPEGSSAIPPFFNRVLLGGGRDYGCYNVYVRGSQFKESGSFKEKSQ
ncbi:MAG: hypothetical protein NTZ01_02040 [Verrucomicrobia bacterium]|nr:hypothetical protein [Verrucomicrobiota bacterium]